MGGIVSTRKAAPARAQRLMLYSEHAAEVQKFEEALKACGTVHIQFSFEHATADALTQLISRAVKTHGLFERIGVAPHGPNRGPPMHLAQSIGDGADCAPWELAANIVLTDPIELTRDSHPVHQVLMALGRATVDGGAVDLLSCSLLSTWACPQSAWPRLRGFSQLEEAAKCVFNASTHALAGSPLQSEDFWFMESDDSINLKQTYFLPSGSSTEHIISEEQLAYARAHPELVRIAQLNQNYILGETLGKGNFAVVKNATKRADAAIFDTAVGTDATPKEEEEAEDSQHCVSPSRRRPRRLDRREIPQHVAIKMVDKGKAEDMDTIRREIGFMSTLRHPNIVRLYEIFESSTHLYLVQELCSGGELFQRILDRGSFTERDAAKFVRELASALQHVHAMGIVHRDVKPENLLCASAAPDSPILVTDFGLASQRLLGGRSSLPKLVNSSRWLNKRKSYVGTPMYVAPEVLASAIYCPACDMWATGVVLYFSLRGMPPFFSENQAHMLQAIKDTRWDHCEGEAWVTISEEVKAIVRGLLEPQYRKRTTAAQLLEAEWVKQDAASAGRESPFRLEAGGGLERLCKYRESSKRLIQP